ncbi:MAG: hypothetical protein EHM79_03185 [Geobacter sp.]|nr:MAG: hypothetical protein EHM79_03185 [Geobacter sp.]
MTIANKEFDLLRAFLKDMFQFEDHDLDFGIYRIIRLKRRFIQRFIDGDSDIRSSPPKLKNLTGPATGSWFFLSTGISTPSAKWLQALFPESVGPSNRTLEKC